MPRSAFVCQQCAYRHAKWLGRCPACGAWDSLAEETEAVERPTPGAGSDPVAFPELDATDAGRATTGLPELDRVLGGGLVAGMTALIGGEPGIGKSTLLLQCADAVARSGSAVLYVSAEESAAQLRLRGERLGVNGAGLAVLAESSVEHVIDAADRCRPALLVVDSIQAIRSGALGSPPGAVSQVRECAARLVDWAKRHGTPVLLVGHVTKDGSIAGPRVLEHVVDTVLQFEGDRHHAQRLLRTLKNRFGAADELGVFAMGERGLRTVSNPSELFLAGRPERTPGSAVVAAVHATRPLLAEVQALVGEPAAGTPRRTTLGVDGARTALVLAVLQRRAGLELASRDVFVNVTGGIQIVEPAVDLAVALAVASSCLGRPVPPDWVLAGELGLTGELRAVGRVELRLREAARLGFRHALVPAPGPGEPTEELRTVTAADVVQAIERVL